MTIHFDVTGERRKELVRALSEITGVASVYLGALGFAYQVGAYTIHRDGSVDAEDIIGIDEITATLVVLLEKGFTASDPEGAMIYVTPSKCVGVDTLNGRNMDESNERILPACTTTRDVDCISLAFPRTGLSEQAIDNLKKIINAKAPLIKLALKVEELVIDISAEKITLPWLPITASHELVEATTQLLAALIALSKKLKRVTAVEQSTDNPRYAFRCLLLRLGFIGNEYKAVRKCLMIGIPGNGSWKHIVV